MEEIFENLSGNQTLKEKVYTNIRELIIKGTLAPGSRLREEELSKFMNISRAPIREALNMLEKDGFATIVPRKGAIVSMITLKDVQDIWEMRRILEPYTARMCVSSLPQSDIEHISAKAKQFQSDSGNMELYMELDLELHQLLYKTLDNRYLHDSLDTINAHSLRIRYFAENDQNVGKSTIMQVMQEHMQIIETLEARHPQQLYDVVLSHVMNSQRRSENAVKKTIEKIEACH